MSKKQCIHGTKVIPTEQGIEWYQKFKKWPKPFTLKAHNKYSDTLDLYHEDTLLAENFIFVCQSDFDTWFIVVRDDFKHRLMALL